MIRIIRCNDTQTGSAGEVFDFDNGSEADDAWDAVAFMWGRDVRDYVILKNGLLRHYDNGNLFQIEKDLATACL